MTAATDAATKSPEQQIDESLGLLIARLIGGRFGLRMMTADGRRLDAAQRRLCKQAIANGDRTAKVVLQAIRASKNDT